MIFASFTRDHKSAVVSCLRCYGQIDALLQSSQHRNSQASAGAGQDGPKAKQTVVASPAGWSNADEQTLEAGEVEGFGLWR